MQVKLMATYLARFITSLHIRLSVGLFIRMSQKPHLQTSHNFPYVISRTVAQSSLTTVEYVLTVLLMTSCFGPMVLGVDNIV